MTSLSNLSTNLFNEPQLEPQLQNQLFAYLQRSNLREKAENLNQFYRQDSPSPQNCDFMTYGLTAANNSSLSSNLSVATTDNFRIDEEFYGESMEMFLSDHVRFQWENAQDEYPSNLKINHSSTFQKKQDFSKVAQNSIGAFSEKEVNRHDETKNIPKNYIKAIFALILQDEDYLCRVFQKLGLDSDNSEMVRFIEFIKLEKKTKRYTIERLKQLWLHPENGKAMRVISCEFLRRRSLSYIYGSKIELKKAHAKYRYRLLGSLKNPEDFTNIK